jgi:hypothetical protein
MGQPQDKNLPILIEKVNENYRGGWHSVGLIIQKKALLENQQGFPESDLPYFA